MKNKILLMKSMYYVPTILGLIRILFTFVVLFSSRFYFRFAYLQIISAIFMAWSVFSHHKLYSDSVPLIRLALPHIMHIFFYYIFLEEIIIAPLIPFIVLDVLFLAIKVVKALLYPFAFEGDRDSLLEEALDSFELE